MNHASQLSNTKNLLTQALMLTSAQLRAARALVSWSRDTLGEKSGTSPETVTGFETRGSDPKRSTMLKWRRALEAAGVEFLDEDQTRRRRSAADTRRWQGPSEALVISSLQPLPRAQQKPRRSKWRSKIY
jgi:transcriptional regulator with XRE-family HTH domain